MLDSASQKVAIFKAWLRRNSGAISSKHNAEDGNFLTSPTSRLMKGDNQGARYCVVSLAKGVTIACERRLVPSAAAPLYVGRRMTFGLRTDALITRTKLNNKAK